MKSSAGTDPSSTDCPGPNYPTKFDEPLNRIEDLEYTHIQLRNRARSLFSQGRFEEVAPILDDIIQSRPSRVLDQMFRLYRGQIAENGCIGEVDLGAAYDDYASLYESTSNTDALQGMARVAIKMDNSNAGLAIEMYEEAIRLGANVSGVMIQIGLIQETILRDLKSACKSYLTAFRNGEPKGLYRFAALKWRAGNFATGAVSFSMWVICAPFIYCFQWMQWTSARFDA